MKKAKFTLVFVSLAAVGCNYTPSLVKQFNDSIDKAMEKKRENLRDLVMIDQNESEVIWNDTNDKVLMTTFHHYPDSYKEHEEITLNWESWVTSAKEFSDVYKDNKDSFTNDPSLRVKQLLGLSYANVNTHITSYWVNPNDLIRPAYVTDPTKQMELTFDEGNLPEGYHDWFDNQYEYAYHSDNAAPWTRLGYTYDWKEGEDRYGLSEFVILKNKQAKVTVEKTAPLVDFLDYLEDL